ncbi:MAG: lipid-transfer protein [Bradyrhizobium sp.]|nr:lipid-transfer protein [Bradyrhizobium sp.]
MTRKAAIAGIGQTEFSKNSGRSELQLAAECVLSALDDAGLQASDVDGMITFTIDTNDDVTLSRCLGVPDVRYSIRVPHGGGGSVATIFHAMSAVASGVADVVVVWRAMNERSGARFGQPSLGAAGGGYAHGSTFLEWCMPYGAQTPGSWVALSAQRYMSLFGVTNEDFGRVSVLQRKHAATNPNAWFYGKPLTLEEHQNSRWVAPPVLRLYDCCQESDGGVALVITSLDRARDLKQTPVEIKGAVQTLMFNEEVISNYYYGDLARMPAAETIARRIRETTGLSPSDCDVAMLYDAFTPEIFKQLEGYGYCGIGEAKDYIKEGNLELDGRSPLNPNGGLIGEGYIHGMNNITEGVRQLRGSAANQVKSVDHVFVASGMAGAILGRG